MKVNVGKSEIDIGQGGTTNSDLEHQGRSGIAWVLKDYGQVLVGEQAIKQQGLQGFQRGQGLIGFGNENKGENQDLG